jgi:glutamate-ammonia-ligase adenylyltransferase
MDRARADAYAARLAVPLNPGSPAHELATLLCTAYPALAPWIEASPHVLHAIASEGHHTARDHAGLMARLRSRTGSLSDPPQVLRELRLFAREERIRIALRELLPPSLGGADVDVTASELSLLAEVTLEIALEEAMTALVARFGSPRTETGAPARFVVLGMGKLGGSELNAGSDIDLMFLYDTDDGAAVGPDGSAISLHDFWTRVARRLTASLEDVTADGLVWRVDLRLRPEGRSGALVNSLAAAERYYESFGRIWERAALLRARPVAGDRALGDEALAILSPFVWTRRVDPSIAVEMVHLVQRSRAKLSHDPARDLKLGPGGIREAEFFVQTLELIWGGREPRLRARGTLDAVRRLRAAGLVTHREMTEIADAYLALRRAEHAVQFATGHQTHVLPDDPGEATRIGRILGFGDASVFAADLAKRRARVAARFRSLLPGEPPAESRWTEAIAALERGNREGFTAALAKVLAGIGDGDGGADATERWADAARDLFELARHPDSVLGARTREAFPTLAETVLDAVVDAADPEQAARYLRALFARFRHPRVYVRLLGDEPRAVRRLVEALGASVFIGDAVVHRPELGDLVLFSRGIPTPDAARAEIPEAIAEAAAAADPDEAPEQVLVGALRRAKARVIIEVGLADLAGEIGTRQSTQTLSALADASMDAATRFALTGQLLPGAGDPPQGLAVIALGKLGGREIGYGSDLDVIFVYDPAKAPPGESPEVYFARRARHVIRLISVPDAKGSGYELDTRLRPSGNRGLLVSSIDAFARYHGVSRGDDGRASLPDSPERKPTDGPEPSQAKAAVWERLALIRARAIAGDPDLGAQAVRIAAAAAFTMPADPAGVAEEIHRIRMRIEHELSQERRGRYDLKLGKGGLVDIEFCVQFLQMRHGHDPRVRTTETAAAIDALAAIGALSSDQAATLQEGRAFLRRLEQRIRIVHATASQLIEEGAPGLSRLARRMGIRDRPGAEAAAELLARYREVTERVRGVYEQIVLHPPAADPP